jgi:hypothetical protein
LEKVRDELNRRIESDEMVAVELKSGVAIYGGFNGTETSLSQRDFETNITILSGDVGAVGDYTDNTYHVVTASGVDASAILDGFTISFL